MTAYYLRNKTLFFIGLLVFFDQLSKYLIRLNGGFYICNVGVAFGILIPKAIIWLIALLFLAGLIYFLVNDNKFLKLKFVRYGIILMFSGIVANLIDRILFGCVIDFIEINFFNYPLFNFADSYIVVGAGLFFLEKFNLISKNNCNN